MSAIIYNQELAKITQGQSDFQDDPIHFNEFEEFEDNGKLNKQSLLIPELNSETALQKRNEDVNQDAHSQETGYRGDILEIMRH